MQTKRPDRTRIGHIGWTLVSAAAFGACGAPTDVAIVDEWEDPGFDFSGQLVAFESRRDGNRELYVMTVDGTDGINITNHPAADGDASWSPDGSRIAFASNRHGNTEIYLMDVDGQNVIRLTDDPAIDRFPSWSPDGSRIAFASDRDGNTEIYVMDVTGTNQLRLTYDDAEDSEPAWLSDGLRLVFFSTRSGNGDVWVMDGDGSDPVNLTNDPSFDASPATVAGAFGADDKIAFVSDRAGGNFDIYTMTLAGGDLSLSRVMTESADDFDSSWTHDGERLVFDSNREGHWDIYMIEAAGTNTVRLTTNSADDESPVWRPGR